MMMKTRQHDKYVDSLTKRSQRLFAKEEKEQMTFRNYNPAFNGQGIRQVNVVHNSKEEAMAALFTFAHVPSQQGPSQVPRRPPIDINKGYVPRKHPNPNVIGNRASHLTEDVDEEMDDIAEGLRKEVEDKKDSILEFNIKNPQNRKTVRGKRLESQVKS